MANVPEPSDLLDHAELSHGSSASPGSPSVGDHKPRKTKQKRNKPTLSCKACVDHKTKCDRGRPACLACLKRSSECEYSEIANILASSDEKRSKSKKARKVAEKSNGDDIGSSRVSIANITHPESKDPSAALPIIPEPRSDNTWVRWSSLPDPAPAPMSVFGMGGEHPFANYWTCKGGLAEVVGVLPSKEQADILISKYFEIVDPLYPIIDRRHFIAEYEHFWSLPVYEQAKSEGAVLALHFVLYATATQYIELPNSKERTKTAEFYLSAAHQALRISSYLNRMTITTVQAMVLFFYFLVNDNHVSDAWTFSGITLRQAYVLQLNREPDIIVPHGSVAEKNLRARLWSAIIYQETSIALFLKLPSTAMQADVGPHSLNYEEADQLSSLPPLMRSPIPLLDSKTTKIDISYCQALWAYACFIQEGICKPRALGLALCNSNEHKRDLISSFRKLYESFPEPFNSYDQDRFFDRRRRVARQQIALAQSFFHSMMLICADENRKADVPTDLYGTLEAAHEALTAFFAMSELFGEETNGWWAYQHRAFEQAMLIANLLASDSKPFDRPTLSSSSQREYNILVTAKEDIARMLQIITQSRGYYEFQTIQERRLDTLQAVYDTITIV